MKTERKSKREMTEYDEMIQLAAHVLLRDAERRGGPGSRVELRRLAHDCPAPEGGACTCEGGPTVSMTIRAPGPKPAEEAPR